MRKPSRLLLWAPLLALAVAGATAGCGSAESRKAHFLAKGQSYMAAGNFDKARVEFRNALQISPNDSEVRFENGVVAESLGGYREAANFYQGALDANPDNVAARTRLARLLLLAGSTTAALDTVKPGLERHPDAAGLLTIRGVARARLGDPATGVADVERARTMAPDSEDTLAALAGLYNAAGRPDDARAVLEDGVRRVPASVDLRAALAEEYLREGATAKAEEPLKQIVTLRPLEPAHRVRLANYYAGAGQADKAEATLRQAVKDLPESTPVRLALVELILARSGIGPAQQELSSMAAARPKDVALQFALAQFYEKQNQPDRAEATLRAVIAQDPRAASALQAKNRLAALEIRRGRRDEATKLIAEVLEKSPRDNDALILRAGLELDAKDAKAAIADLRSVLRDQPNSVPVLDTLAKAHEMNGEPALADTALRRALDADPNATGVALDLIDLLGKTGKLDEARTIAEQLYKREPDNPAVLLAVFRAQVALKDYAAARGTAATAVAAHPAAPIGYYLTGLISEAQGNDAEAIRSYAKAADMAPGAEQPLDALIRLQVRAGRVTEAHERLTALLATDPKNARISSLDGEVLFAAGRLPEAERAFRSAIAEKPQWFPPYKGLALLKLKNNDSDGAIAILVQAGKAVVPPDSARFALAELYQRLRRPDEAIAIYEQILAADPHSDVAANNLAMLLVTTRTDPESLKRANELVARFADSTVVQYIDTNGWVRFKGGDVNDALPVLQKAVALDPAAPNFRYHLAMAELRVGQTDAARANLQQALKSGDGFEGAPQAREALAQVGGPTAH